MIEGIKPFFRKQDDLLERLFTGTSQIDSASCQPLTMHSPVQPVFGKRAHDRGDATSLRGSRCKSFGAKGFDQGAHFCLPTMHGAKKVYGMNLVDQRALDISCTTSIHTRSLARINHELTQYPQLNAQYISVPNHTGIISLSIASEKSNLRTSIAAHVNRCARRHLHTKSTNRPNIDLVSFRRQGTGITVCRK